MNWGGVREERIASIGAWGREYGCITASAEQSPHLLACAAHCGGRGHDFGPYDLLSIADLHLASTEFVDDRLIEAPHRSQRSGDEVEFVLDDQIRGLQPLGERPACLIAAIAGAEEALAWLSMGHAAEQLPGRSHPGRAANLSTVAITNAGSR